MFKDFGINYETISFLELYSGENFISYLKGHYLSKCFKIVRNICPKVTLLIDNSQKFTS